MSRTTGVTKSSQIWSPDISSHVASVTDKSSPNDILSQDSGFLQIVAIGSESEMMREFALEEEEDEVDEGYDSTSAEVAVNCQFCDGLFAFPELEAHIKGEHLVSTVYKCGICGFVGDRGLLSQDEMSRALLSHLETSHGQISLTEMSRDAMPDADLSFAEASHSKEMTHSYVNENHNGDDDETSEMFDLTSSEKSILLQERLPEDRLGTELPEMLEETPHLVTKRKMVKGPKKPTWFKLSKRRSLTCRFCDFRFARASDLLEHFKENHKKAKMYSCHLCEEYQGNSAYYFKKHLEQTHQNLANGETVLTVPQEVPIVERQSPSVTKKIAKVDQKQPFARKEKQFGQRKRNIEKERGVRLTLDCCCCPFIAPSKEVIKIHYEQSHRDKFGQFVCSACLYSSAIRNNFVRHCSTTFHLKKLQEEENVKKTEKEAAREVKAEVEEFDLVFPCSFCDHSTDSRKDTIKHMQESHRAEFAQYVQCKNIDESVL